jgi:hypothetical protein
MDNVQNCDSFNERIENPEEQDALDLFNNITLCEISQGPLLEPF